MNNKIKNKEEIKVLINKNLEYIKSFDISSLAIFGSYSSNEAKPLSDLDILVNFKKNTFRNYIGLKYFLEKLLGMKVDLVCENTIKPILKPYIMKDVEWLVN
jgi:predicted nucleotidyltransferase